MNVRKRQSGRSRRHFPWPVGPRRSGPHHWRGRQSPLWFSAPNSFFDRLENRTSAFAHHSTVWCVPAKAQKQHPLGLLALDDHAKIALSTDGTEAPDNFTTNMVLVVQQRFFFLQRSSDDRRIRRTIARRPRAILGPDAAQRQRELRQRLDSGVVVVAKSSCQHQCCRRPWADSGFSKTLSLYSSVV
jgi:hypothetical protein